MKSIIVPIVAAVLVVGCGESQQSAPATETKPVEPVAEVPVQQLSPPVELKPVELIGEVPAQNVKPANPKADRALLDAAGNGNIEAARQAIADGADVDTLDKRGRAPIQNALHSNNIEAVKLLIDNGANLNTKAPNSWTPLYEAVLMGRMETVKLLIENGANVNAKDQMGGTPLDQVQNEEIIDYLRLYGGKTGAELKAEGK
ncbi:ankyrin repeat domain-containing protein [bacterium]|nr:ankyrin repeat domain-containing protein [bacterium]